MRKLQKLHRKFKRNKKNFLLKGITYSAVLLWAVTSCLLDSDNWQICFAVWVISFLWITLFSYVNTPNVK